MTKKQKALAAIEALKKEYPDAECALIHSNPLQLLIATRLSAQCTDARVNMVTPALFERFPTIDDFINSSEEEIAEYIRTCGLFKTKARDIFAMCNKLREEFNGIVPDKNDTWLYVQLVDSPTVLTPKDLDYSDPNQLHFNGASRGTIYKDYNNKLYILKADYNNQNWCTPPESGNTNWQIITQ